MIRLIFGLSFIFLFLQAASAQTVKTKSAVTSLASSQVKNSAAYAEVVLQKVELESELEELLSAYTEQYPKVKETRFRLDVINKSVEKLLSVNASEASKLTAALGKLLVRKSELETELWKLSQQLNAEHPDIKRAKRKVEIFDKAIKEILP